MGRIRSSVFALLACGLTSCAADELDADTVTALFGTDPRVLRAARAEPSEVRLGAELFHAEQSCARCHELSAGRFGAGRVLQSVVAVDGTARRRDVPALYDAVRQIVWGWDGWFADPVGMRLEDAVERCSTNLDRMQPPAAPLGEARDERIQALTAYLASLETHGRWDRFVDGDRDALTAAERRGLEVFVRTGCAACHGTRLLGGRSIHPLGVAEPWPTDDDPGRFAVTGDDRDRACFEAPPLRLVAHTAPYFHDGSVDELSEAIRRMARHELGKELVDAEVAAIEVFLRAVGELDPR